MNRRELLTVLGGSAAVWPFAALAQQKAMPVVGFLSVASPEVYAPNVSAVRRGLAESGYVEGKNVGIEYRWGEGDYERLPALAAELVRRNVDVIIATGGTVSARAAKNATTAIPIIFVSGGDPVAAGLVASLARPGGNVTGVSIITVELMAKRLDLLTELVPQADTIAVLVNPNNPNTERMVRDTQDTARAKGVKVQVVNCGSAADFESAFANVAESRAGALAVAADAFFNTRHREIVALATRHKIPAIYEWREFVDAGGLASYGPNLLAIDRLAGIYAGRILAGVKAADLPVEQPTKFELVINLKTAKTLGLTVPQALLARADEVIE